MYVGWSSICTMIHFAALEIDSQVSINDMLLWKELICDATMIGAVVTSLVILNWYFIAV